MRNTTRSLFALLALSGLAIPAFAQNSVSTNPDGGDGLPGDALDPWSTLQQCADYVVDLVPFQTSKGFEFGIAPIVKANKSSSDFFNSLISAQGISNVYTQAEAFPVPIYDFWDTAGPGVNLFGFQGGPVPNTAPGEVQPEGESLQFGVGFAEFGTSDSNRDYNAIVGAVVNVIPGDPSRLYVARRTAATNSAAPTENRSQFGFGAVDANGNVAFRSDDFGVTGPNSIAGNNLFRVSILDRTCDVLNFIDLNGGNDGAATTDVLRGSGVAHNTPTIIPASIAGRPVLIGSNFNREYVHESTPGSLSSSTAHRPSTSDHRGNVAFGQFTAITPASASCPADLNGDGDVGSADLALLLGAWGGAGPADLDMSGMVGSADLALLLGAWGPCPLPDVAGSAAMLTKSNAGGGDTDSLSVWTVDNDGAVVDAATFPRPNMVSDPVTGLTITVGNPPAAEYLFEHYRSQVAFRGGNGQVAIGQNPDTGRSLLSAVAFFDGGNATDPENYVLVADFDPSNPTDVNWSLAAHPFKPICDAAGNEIGRLIFLFDVTGGSPFGPSISPPAFDRDGNIYFLSALEIDLPDGSTDTGTGLVRGVRNPAGGWNLELVLQTGDVFTSANTGLEYQIRFLGIADDNSTSSGTFWSNNVLQSGALDRTPAEFGDPGDPRALGGLVLSASIVYDVDEDGNFDIPTGANGVPGAVDEQYNALLYIGSLAPQGQ